MRCIRSAVATLACIACAAQAFAQTSDATLNTIAVAQQDPPENTPPPPAEHEKLETVIVTAQRREENAQTVPISITVLDEKKIANANITNASDLASYTPSLSINPRFGNENASFSIRGFTQDLRTTASVGTYFADVVAPRGQILQTSGDGAGPGAFFDLQNVQVLKGPQGTLFGRNTTGGAVLIVPHEPGDHFEGYGEISRGANNLWRGQAVVNLPILFDRLKIRVGFDRNSRDGYLNNILRVGADDLANVNYKTYRLSAKLKLTDSLDNYFIANYVDSMTHGETARLYACNSTPNPTGNAVGTAVLPITGPPCNAQLQMQADSGQDGFYDIVSPIKTPITAIREKRFINTTTWELAENFSLKNIVSYAHLNTLNGSDVFGTHFTETAAGLPTTAAGLAALLALGGSPVDLPPLPPTFVADPRREFVIGVSVVNPTFPTTSQKTWIEELRASGHTANERLQWQAGGYYEHSMPDGFSGSNSAALLSCEVATLEGPPDGYNCFDVSGGFAGVLQEFAFKMNYLNRAVYGQATYDLLEQLSLTAGARYTWDKTSGYGMRTLHTWRFSEPQPPTVVLQTPEVESTAPTGVIELSYKPIRDVMAYAKYVRGYRQGSVNMASDPGIDTFKPEHVNTYEIGAKTEFGGFLPGRFNVAAFYNDLRDMQLQAGYISPTAGTTTAIFNAGKAKIAGVEAEAFFQLFRDLSLSLSYSYLDTKLIEQENHQPEVQAAGGPIAGGSYTPIADTGDTLPFAANHTAVASLNYRLPLPASIGAINFGTTYVYTGTRRTGATSATPYDELPPFRLLNFNLNWIAIFGSAFDLSGFVTNMLNEEFVTYSSGTYNLLGFDSRIGGLPRMAGARLRYNFGALAR